MNAAGGETHSSVEAELRRQLEAAGVREAGYCDTIHSLTAELAAQREAHRRELEAGADAQTARLRRQIAAADAAVTDLRAQLEAAGVREAEYCNTIRIMTAQRAELGTASHNAGPENQRRPRLELPAILERLDTTIDEFFEPENYRAATEELARYCREHPHDVRSRLMLANAHRLATMGGTRAWERLSRVIDEGINRSAAVRVLEEAAAIAPEDPQVRDALRAARQEATPAILMASLPRSGSVYLFHSLAHGLRKAGYGGAVGGVFPNHTVCQDGLARVIRLGLAAHTHLAPSRANLIEISVRHKLERMLVQVRDPRQAMISWYHFMPSVVTKLDHTQALHYRVPEEYWTWPTERQLDWQIDHWLVWVIDWIRGWVEAENEPWFTTKLHFARHEDLVADPKRFFDDILAFYGIDRELFDYPSQPTFAGDRNFRLGTTDEWRRLLTPEQIERASAKIPQTLYERFGWPPT